MSADLFDKRFLSVRVPAWHQLGTVVDDPVTAREALELIGDYNVTLETVAVPSVNVGDFGMRAIVRHPVSDDPEYRIFGTVSDHYTLITPSEMADIWDVSTKAKIETIGALRKGEVFFISTKLPTFKVVDDEVDNYLLASNSMNGKQSASVRVTPVRVVCTNTLALSAAKAVESFLIPHNSQARGRMEKWLTQAYADSVFKLEAIQQAFELLAGTRATPDMVTAVSYAAYPNPVLSMRPTTPDVMQSRTALYERELEFAVDSRKRVAELFAGAGTGMTSLAADGTVWGLYNAVTEAENYRRMRGVQNSSYDVLYGSRAETMARAYDMSVKVAEQPTDVPIPFTAAFA